MATSERIAIIGDGNVGRALKEGFERAGHQVQATGKDPKRVHEAADWAQIVVLAVPYSERGDAFHEMGDAVSGKTVVDVTNAVGEKGFAGNTDRSGAEELQQKHGDAHIVKAFNTVFAQNMAAGQVGGEPLSLFVAGDEDGPKRQVLELGRELGYDPVDAGPLQNARWLEALGFLNIQLGYQLDNGTQTGFRYVHPGARKATEPPAMAQRA